MKESVAAYVGEMKMPFVETISGCFFCGSAAAAMLDDGMSYTSEPPIAVCQAHADEAVAVGARDDR